MSQTKAENMKHHITDMTQVEHKSIIVSENRLYHFQVSISDRFLAFQRIRVWQKMTSQLLVPLYQWPCSPIWWCSISILSKRNKKKLVLSAWPDRLSVEAFSPFQTRGSAATWLAPWKTRVKWGKQPKKPPLWWWWCMAVGQDEVQMGVEDAADGKAGMKSLS